MIKYKVYKFLRLILSKPSMRLKLMGITNDIVEFNEVIYFCLEPLIIIES